jgi:hypothetical protein
MSDLVVIAFPTEAKAEEVRQKLLAMQKEYLIELGDAVVAVKDGKGNIKLNQLINTTAAGAVGGAFWGSLIGLIFLMPLVGAQGHGRQGSRPAQRRRRHGAQDFSRPHQGSRPASGLSGGHGGGTGCLLICRALIRDAGSFKIIGAAAVPVRFSTIEVAASAIVILSVAFLAFVGFSIWAEREGRVSSEVSAGPSRAAVAPHRLPGSSP